MSINTFALPTLLVVCLPFVFTCPPFSMWQGAAAFNNHSLSFDTSSVTDMSYMFEVCCARAMSHL